MEINLNEINQYCLNPYNKARYTLIGIVSYKGAKTTRNSQIGHYTALVLRMGIWIEYNDLEKKEKRVKMNAKIIPALLMYAKEQ